MAFGTLKADTLTHSTAGSLDTNYVVNGSAKSWINQFEGTSVNDSLNCTSLTDVATGIASHSFVNAHSNKNYAASGSAIGDSSTQTTAQTYSFVGGASNEANSTHTTAAIRYSTVHHAGSVNDQQMVQVITHGELA